MRGLTRPKTLPAPRGEVWAWLRIAVARSIGMSIAAAIICGRREALVDQQVDGAVLAGAHERPARPGVA